MQTGLYCNHQGEGSPAGLAASLALPDAGIATAIHIVFNPDDVAADRYPVLDWVLAHAGRPIDISISLPLCLTAGQTYPFATRDITASFMGGAPFAMAVPVLSAANGPAVSAWRVWLVQKIMARIAAASGSFRVMAVSCNLVSGAPKDATLQLASDVSETTPEARLAGWAALEVTPESVQAAQAAHAADLAAATDPSVYLPIAFYQPLLACVGRAPDGGASTTAIATAVSAVLQGAGRLSTLFDPSANPDGSERAIIGTLAALFDTKAGQLVSGNPVPGAEMAVAEDWVWMEVEGADLALLAAAGFGGAEFSTQ